MNESEMNAADAFERYQIALTNDALIQRSWHCERNGRQLACALGVIGPEIQSPADCPANVMPRWLAQMTVWFFDNQDFANAKDWGLRFYAELKRLNGKVPFSVVHDWQANVIGPFAIATAIKRKREVAPHEALMELHARALIGEKIARDNWYTALFLAAKNAYAYANAYANANAYADANADANAKQKNIKHFADGMIDCLKRVK